MLLDEIIAGESKTIEFKEVLPEKSSKYMKTVVAYANGNGGKLIFGVKDDTNEVIGIDSESLFKTMDAITNAISDSCEPLIVPDITLQTVDGKTLIIVEINAGKQRPYYLKSLGLQRGVYIRVSGTTRLADDYMIKELLFEGSNRYFDQTVVAGYTVSEKEINDLCISLKETALKNCNDKEERNRIKDVTKNTLLSWGVLVEKDGQTLPTNAFALLTGNQKILAPCIQCAVFKGTTRAIFVDRREFDGPIQNQLDQAYEYVLTKINLGAKIEGLYRQDVYEMPISSIREIISNAIVHRSYLEPGNIQIALYDNRLEITSPGMLLNGVTLEKIKEGYSKVRNRAIASAFTYMKIIEKWGSGIPRIMQELNEYNLKEPELIDFDGDFRVNFYRNQSIGTTQATQATQGTTQATQGTTQASQDILFELKKAVLNEKEVKIIMLIVESPSISQSEIANSTNLSINSVKYYINKLKKNGLLTRVGTSQNGKWEIIIKELN